MIVRSNVRLVKLVMLN